MKLFKACKREKGFTLIEVLIVIAVLMVVTPVLYSALQLNVHDTTMKDGQATAEALAKSEMEFIKAQTYQPNVTWGYSITSTSGTRPWAGGPTVPIGFTVGVTTAAVPSGLVALVTNGGQGYTSVPTVTFTGGGGSGATGAAVITKGIATITMGTKGSGYSASNPPVVRITGGGGTGASAMAIFVGNVFDHVNVTNVGRGFTSAPVISFSGGGGTGATATATLTGSYVLGVTITNQGSGYTSAPSATFSGGGGSGATAITQVSQPSLIQEVSVTVTRGTAANPWTYVDYILKDYWRAY